MRFCLQGNTGSAVILLYRHIMRWTWPITELPVEELAEEAGQDETGEALEPAETPEPRYVYGALAGQPEERYLASRDELDELAASLDAQGIEYTVEDIDVSAYEGVDGMRVNGWEEAEALVSGAYTPPLSVDDLALALAEQYEENLTLREELANTQMALAEIYEHIMEVENDG